MRARTPWWFLCVSVLAAGCTDDAPTTLERPVTSCRVAPFDNVTLAVGVDFVHHPHTSFCEAQDGMGPGVCMIDYDRDGDIDLYFVDRSPYANRLYRNDGGRFSDVTIASGAGDAHDGLGCLAVDYDRDGDEDLYLSNFDGDRLLRNDGGHFDDVTSASGIRTEGITTSATAGDIDGDGDIDIAVGRFLDPATLPTVCTQKIKDATPLSNLLFVNRGGRFTEESLARGLTHVDPTLVMKLYDIDDDSDPDLYVGNDLGRFFPDRFYINDGRGYFTDQARAMGVAYARDDRDSDTMGVAFGDVDLDGFQEIVSSTSDQGSILLYHCDRTRRCAEVPDAWGLRSSHPGFGWALGLEDFDLDGDLDLLVANGSFYVPAGQRNQLFWNVGGRFVEHATTEDEALAAVQSSRGAVFGDLDGDGAVDAVVANVGARPEVLLNRAGCGHWLAVRLDPPVAGARVRVTAGGRTLERQLSLGGSYLGSNSATLHFGLGLSPSASLEVRWPGGRVLRRDPSPIDQVLTVR